MSAHPVRYHDGVIRISSTDLMANGFGVPWGETRSWTNGPGHTLGSNHGNGWNDSQLPHLLTHDDDLIITVVLGGIDACSSCAMRT
jgi:hypothetical protein